MIKKILYPTDFSDVARKAMAYIGSLKKAGATEVVLVHVIDHRNFDALAGHMSLDFGQIMKAFEEKAAGEMNRIAGELRAQGYEVKLRIEMGIPFREILRISEEENVSVIVMGSHGKSNLADMLIGSVAEKVIRHSRKPVLVVTR
jgi:nucleotide-binding universal stress UspA family protein